MGLTGEDDRYNKFRAIARISATKYLDLTKTIRAQDPIVVGYLLELLQIKHPFLQRFENMWPMRDMIGQFLRHHNAYSKHRPIIQTSDRGDDDSDDLTDSDDSEDGDDTEDEDETEDEEENDGDEYDQMGLGQLAGFLSEPSNHPSTSNATKGTRKSKSSPDTISKVPQHVSKRKQPAVCFFRTSSRQYPH
ncbi:hypothetical protein BDR03DRAFT_944038 [Suillus americanus]|nr:hypothetical protein BDR03DRAFT_944038 [Suillus americanus]